VLVGGGNVALRKVKVLLNHGATVISPDLCHGLIELVKNRQIHIPERRLQSSDLPRENHQRRTAGGSLWWQIMEMMAPSGPVYQAGTLSGNPLARTAGIETLKALEVPGVYERLEDNAAVLGKELVASALETDIGIYISRVASLLTVFFTGSPVTDYESEKQADTALFGRFFHGMLSGGIYVPPSQFEASFISLAHSENDIDQTIEAANKELKSFKVIP
jgi:glutamate-1-semialdehyde aminotransferase